LEKILEKILTAALAPLLAVLTEINNKLNVAAGVIAPQPATPAAVNTPVVQTATVVTEAPAPAPQAPLTFRDLLVAGMRALANGDVATIGAVLAQIKAIALPNDPVPTDARGLLGKALIEIAKEDREKAFAIIGQFIPSGSAVELNSVPKESYPALAKALGDALSAKPLAGLL
jgi:hypothetical protein